CHIYVQPTPRVCVSATQGGSRSPTMRHGPLIAAVDPLLSDKTHCQLPGRRINHGQSRKLIVRAAGGAGLRKDTEGNQPMLPETMNNPTDNAKRTGSGL